VVVLSCPLIIQTTTNKNVNQRNLIVLLEMTDSELTEIVHSLKKGNR
jgi:hypothetical protein